MTMACRRYGAGGTQSLCNPYAPSDNPKKGTRPRASDRSMADTVQPQRLLSFEADRRRRYSRRCHEMEQPKSTAGTTPD